MDSQAITLSTHVESKFGLSIVFCHGRSTKFWFNNLPSKNQLQSLLEVQRPAGGKKLLFHPHQEIPSRGQLSILEREDTWSSNAVPIQVDPRSSERAWCWCKEADIPVFICLLHSPLAFPYHPISVSSAFFFSIFFTLPCWVMAFSLLHFSLFLSFLLV